MDLLVTVKTGEQTRRIAWVSLQPDGSVSVGLSDRTFVAPDFKARRTWLDARDARLVPQNAPLRADRTGQRRTFPHCRSSTPPSTCGLRPTMNSPTERLMISASFVSA